MQVKRSSPSKWYHVVLGPQTDPIILLVPWFARRGVFRFPNTSRTRRLSVPAVVSETVFRPQGERDGCSLIYLEFRLPWVVDEAVERTLGRLEAMA